MSEFLKIKKIKSSNCQNVKSSNHPALSVENLKLHSSEGENESFSVKDDDSAVGVYRMNTSVIFAAARNPYIFFLNFKILIFR